MGRWVSEWMGWTKMNGLWTDEGVYKHQSTHLETVPVSFIPTDLSLAGSLPFLQIFPQTVLAWFIFRANSGHTSQLLLQEDTQAEVGTRKTGHSGRVAWGPEGPAQLLGPGPRWVGQGWSPILRSGRSSKFQGKPALHLAFQELVRIVMQLYSAW